MYLLITEQDEIAKNEPWPGIHLTKADLMTVLRMFINTFGTKPLRDRPDLNRHHFYYVGDLVPWEMAIALQIAVDTTAACDVDDERVVRLKQHFRKLLGTCKNETTVVYQSRVYVIERPAAPF
jgi:hypothetical protein